MAFSSYDKIPIDPSNKLAMSIQYYIPTKFTKEHYYDPYSQLGEFKRIFTNYHRF